MKIRECDLYKEYRRLGRSGLKVSVIGLGSWINFGEAEQESRALACIEKAFECGINFFDTANSYGQGSAEKFLGRALKRYPRESFVLATKAFFPMGSGVNNRGLSRKHIFEQVHQSLKRLNVDYIDLWQCHRFDPDVPLDETMRAIDDLIRQGKILYAGVSEWSVSQMREAFQVAESFMLDRFVSNQTLYNLLERGIELEILPFCQQHGIGNIVWSPLAQGVLTGKYKPGVPLPEGSRATHPEGGKFVQKRLTNQNFEYVKRLSEMAAAKNFTPAQLALSWVLSQSSVSSAIIGTSRPEQIEENVHALKWEWTNEELLEISQITQSKPV